MRAAITYTNNSGHAVLVRVFEGAYHVPELLIYKEAGDRWSLTDTLEALDETPKDCCWYTCNINLSCTAS